MIPDPYHYVHAMTFGLGTLWTAMGLRRLARFGKRWSARLEGLGLSREWLRRRVISMALRATVLDPINLALMLLLLLTWSLRAWIEQ
ncbi:MAG TPA: hypothetical protein ENJ09_16105 [Planctomycetes bacterium]|nr:hypothetical protein [Planctomycetota bacterium]